jgi:hypothetical protein
MEIQTNYENQNSININTIGVGIFLWTSINSSTSLIHTIIEKTLMLNSVPFEISFWIYNGLSFIFYCVITFFALNYFKNKKNINYSKIYLVLIITIIALMFGRIIFQYISINFIDKLYREEFIYFNENQSENIFLYSFISIFEYLKYICLGIILLILNNSKS